VDQARRKSFRSLSALGGFAIHRSGVEGALFQPALDVMYSEKRTFDSIRMCGMKSRCT